MKSTAKLFFLAVTLSLAWFSDPAFGQAPGTISFQGVLTDTTSGLPVDDPNATIDFNLLNGSGPVWSETHTGVEVVDGGFNVLLGSVTPLTGYEFFEGLSLVIEYKGQTFAPRIPLTSAPYAMGLHLPILAEAPVGGTAFQISNTGPGGDGIRGISNAGTGAGLHGRGEAFVGENYGVYGFTASAAGSGVYGIANTIVASAPNYGVYGKSNSDSGYGVYGEAPEVGVFGIATGGNVTDHGVHGETTTGLGVYGFSSGGGTGVYGQTTGTGQAGHFEINNASNSNNALFAWTNGTGDVAHFESAIVSSDADAVYAKTNGTGRAGFFEKTNASDDDVALMAQTNGSGYALSAVNTGTGPGLYASSADNSENAGYFDGRLFATHSIETDGFVEGRNGSFNFPATPSMGAAVTAIADGDGWGLRVVQNGNGTAVRVNANGTGLAGDFQGDVHVGGDLTTSGDVNPMIDHPLDRANKYLNHFGVSSSEVLDVYSGNVVTDGSGRAVVDLPDWFEALNSDFRYQLTVVGTFAQAIIERKIQNNRFVIATNQPRVEVSWQVTAVRTVAGREHPPVEQDKPAELRGTYVNQ